MPCNCLGFCNSSSCYCKKHGIPCYSNCRCCENGGTSCKNGGRPEKKMNKSPKRSKSPEIEYTAEERQQGMEMSKNMMEGIMGGMGIGGGMMGQSGMMGFGQGQSNIGFGTKSAMSTEVSPTPRASRIENNCCPCSTCHTSTCPCLLKKMQCGPACESSSCQNLRLQQNNLFREFFHV